MNLKKVIVSGLVAVLLYSTMATSVFAQSGPRPHRPDVMNATADTENAQWLTGVSQDGGAKGESIKMTDFAYYSFRNWWDQKLSNVKKVRASWKLDGENSDGSPRFSLQLDANADGSFTEPTGNSSDTDVNVFLDPTTCGKEVKDGWIESDFTGNKADCTITDSTGNSYVSDADGTAWKKLVTAYPNAKVWFMFVIQDATTGVNYVDRIYLDNAFFTKIP